MVDRNKNVLGTLGQLNNLTFFFFGAKGISNYRNVGKENSLYISENTYVEFKKNNNMVFVLILSE